MPEYDVIVVGAGHAGVEAALAAARLHRSVLLVTLDRHAIARMSCNPAIGGLAKGHLVREIDALGGEMGLAADATGIQFKMLNKSKGHAVWSPRAQVDKKQYQRYMQQTICLQSNISIVEGEAKKVLVSNGRVSGISLHDGTVVKARSVVLTCGTFLNGLIHIGRRKISAGRMGEEASDGITESLLSLGFTSKRLKTGTPPRLRSHTIDWRRLRALRGDEKPHPFSFRTRDFSPPSIPCHLTHTNDHTHAIIRSHLNESPMYSGEIEGIGPRYCPSIEDKVVRFAERSSHQVFLEPEWRGSSQIYANGFSTSLPANIQLEALRSLPGLENVRFHRPGYAIEYDFFPPSQLKASLETKGYAGLFHAGQINGTSGYEEAAAQGLIAGINAASYVNDAHPIVLRRHQAYIGVLIDDLVTKDTSEPYRMFTARAEYRLMLRHSNADRRLSRMGFQLGLISPESYARIDAKLEMIDSLVSHLSRCRVQPEEINPILKSLNDTTTRTSTRLRTILKRPAVSIDHLLAFLPTQYQPGHHFPRQAILEEAEAIVKYEGYIKRQNIHIDRLARNESAAIPSLFDYSACRALSSEAREKLARLKPETLGQASRISGVSPSDVAALAVLLSA